MKPLHIFTRSTGKRHNLWLLFIAAYKLLHALVFFAVGVGAHRLIHRDVAGQIELLARHLRFNPESRLVDFILEKASLINDPVLRRIGLVAYCDATVTLVEGVGLYLEKPWAKYITLAITASFLPWEVLEIIRRLDWIRVGLLAITILVFVYLLLMVRASARVAASPNRPR